ncbi:MAG: tetratricopeptide repeat protein [Burkholderiales bacterium]
MNLPQPKFHLLSGVPASALPRLLGALAAAAALLYSAAVLASEYTDIQGLASSGNAKAALARADKSIAANPRDPQLKFLKGVIQSDAGMKVEAEQTFLALTRQYPELPEPYNNLAAIYAQLNQYDKARESLEMAVRLNPGYAVAHENLGDVYARLAAEAYARSRQLDPANPKLPLKLAQIRELLAPKP